MTLPLLEVRDAGPKGKGVFALEPIVAGTVIIPLGGTVLQSHELTDDMLALQLGPDLWLCSDGSLLDDMMNHSCEPNAGFLDGSPVLSALRDISMNEEILWDYSTSLSEMGWMLECCCGAASCRKIVRSWPELEADERERLRAIALQYLREELPEMK